MRPEDWPASVRAEQRSYEQCFEQSDSVPELEPRIPVQTLSANLSTSHA